MAFTPGGDDGTLNGTTPVTLVSAPAASTQRISKIITIKNTDSAQVTVTVRKVSGGGTRQIVETTLDVDDTLVIDEVIVLDDTSSSITAIMSGAAATTNPDWTSSFADVS